MARWHFWPLYRVCPSCGKRDIAAWNPFSGYYRCRRCFRQFRKIWYLEWPWFFVLQAVFLLLLPATFLTAFSPLSWYFMACVGVWILVFLVDALIPLRETQVPRPSNTEIASAKAHPGGLLYRVAGPFGPRDPVPPEAIVGAWRVNAHGEIVGDFERNRRYDPALWSSGQITSRTGPRDR
jgi:hypothetical protein